VIAEGEQVPDAQVWLGRNDPVNLSELSADGPFLLLFYLLDWSST
jgi:hypothetical protein